MYDDPNVRAVSYASQLGTFANEGVEVFTPWDWMPGQWEVLHLFSRYAGTVRVQSNSDLDTLVSAYASINAAEDTLTIILVNRDRNKAQMANVKISNYTPEGTTFSTLQLNDLPVTETFTSHTSNALVKGSVAVNNGAFSIDLPTVSITAAIITKKAASIRVPSVIAPDNQPRMRVSGTTLHVNRGATRWAGEKISLYDTQGRKIRSWTLKGKGDAHFSLQGIGPGHYVLFIDGSGWFRPVLLNNR